MNIFTKEYNPPSEHITDKFVLFFTNDHYSEADHKAVMDSRDFLRKWSQSPWPEDSFTNEENKEDLKLHMQDNLDHSAYGYMIFNHDRSICYGSVYVNTLTNIPEHYHVSQAELAILEKYDARIVYWTVEGFDEVVVVPLDEWFRKTWKINPLFASRKELTDRERLYQKLKMSKKIEVISKTSTMSLQLYSTSDK